MIIHYFFFFFLFCILQYPKTFYSSKKMYKAEGVGSFWKGIAAPLMVETPKRAWKFCTFENFKNALNYRGQDKQPSPLTYSMAGFLAGATEGIIVNPFEAIKVNRLFNISSIRLLTQLVMFSQFVNP